MEGVGGNNRGGSSRIDEVVAEEKVVGLVIDEAAKDTNEGTGERL